MDDKTRQILIDNKCYSLIDRIDLGEVDVSLETFDRNNYPSNSKFHEVINDYAEKLRIENTKSVILYGDDLDAEIIYIAILTVPQKNNTMDNAPKR